MRGQKVILNSGEVVTVLDVSDSRVFILNTKNETKWIQRSEIKELYQPK